MSTAREAPANERGFTLLEVLVAFIIAALAIGVLIEGATIGLGSARISGHYEEAVSRARSRLAAIGLNGQVSLGGQSGDDGGGFAWRTQTSRIAASPVTDGNAPAGPQSPRAILYDVTVSILWSFDGGQRKVTLETERLGVSAPSPP